MISIGAPKTIAVWFRGQERGMAVGLYTTGPWIGGMTALAATNALVMPLTGQSWRLTLVCYGGLTLVFALLWGVLAREADPDGPSERFSTLRVLVGLLRVRRILMVLLSGLLSFAIMHGYVNWLPKILENAGMSPTRAGLTAAVPYMASIPAVLILPRTIPPHLRGRAVALMAALAGVATIWVTAGAFFPVAGLLLFGGTGACLFPLLMLMLMDSPEVGAKYLGSAAGVFFCVAEMGGFLGPFVVGFLVDWTGGFLSGAAFLAGLGLAVFAMMFRVGSRAPSRAGS
jgi:cyanate permease